VLEDEYWAKVCEMGAGNVVLQVEEDNANIVCFMHTKGLEMRCCKE